MILFLNQVRLKIFRMSISVVIPTYEQQGYGARYLTELLESIKRQQYNGQYEVIVSDNATDGSIKQVCDNYPFVTYHFNPVRGASENINNAIELAKYDKVKIMCQDDTMFLPTTLQLFSDALDKSGWAISNSKHTDANSRVTGQRLTRYIHWHFEDNITGMPSVTAFRKSDIRFMPELKTVCDMFFYYQLYELYGAPAVIQQFAIGCRFHNSSLSRNQQNRHVQDVNYLIRKCLIPGKLPKVVVAIVVYDRIENALLWKQLYPDVVIINNGPHDIPCSIRRPNIGYDIGAFQDVCAGRLKGFPDFDYLLWCVDDTVPMQPDFVDQYLDAFGKKIGCVCMHLSTEMTPHIRTTGFMLHKSTMRRLRFAADPVTTLQHCHQFEYKGLHLLKQLQSMGLKVAQVAPLHKSPLYDMNYWSRNDNAKLLKHLLYRDIK